MDLTIKQLHSQTRRPLEAWYATVFLAPLASCITWLLLKIFPKARPNIVTTCSLLFGIVSACLFLSGHIVSAVLLYQICMSLDWVDGKVARLTGQTSAFGAFYDGLVNHLVFILNLIGLGFSLEVSTLPMSLVISLLGLRAVNNYVNDFLECEVEGSWSHFVADDQSWLTKKGLLPPGSFPDKHAVLFLLGPLLWTLTDNRMWALGGLSLVFGMDTVLILLKLRKAKKRMLSA